MNRKYIKNKYIINKKLIYYILHKYLYFLKLLSKISK